VAGTRYIDTALKPNNDITLWFEEEDANVKAYHNFQEEFGNDRVIMLTFQNDSGVFSFDCLASIAKLEKALLKIRGVKRVSSLLNVKDFRRVRRGGVMSIAFKSWFEQGPERINLSRKDSISASPLIAGRLLSQHENVGQVIIHLDDFEKIHDQMSAIIPAIRNVCNQEFGSENVHLGGADMITHGINDLSRKDFVKFTGLGYLTMFLVIGLLYRRAVYVIMALFTALTAVLATLSIYGYFGFGLNIFTVMTPTLVITMSIINVMHIINKFKNVRRDAVVVGREAVVGATLSDVVLPCFYASMTTVIGFLSLVTSNTAILKEFGWLTAIGCLFAFLFSFIWSSIFLFVAYKGNDRASIIEEIAAKFSCKLTSGIQRNYKTFSLIATFVTVISVGGILTIKLDMYPLGYFPNNHPVRIDHDFMERYWGKYYPIDLVLELDSGINLREPAVIHAMIKFHRLLASYEEIGKSVSYINILERLADVSYRKSLIEVIHNPFLANTFFERSKRLLANESGTLISKDSRKIRINVTGSMLSVKELEKNLSKLDKDSQPIFEDIGLLKTAGYPALFINIMNYAFSSMKSSLSWAFLFVLISMILLLRNLKLSFIALIPNIFPLIVLLGFLGYFKINLDLATCTVAAIILGIAIDDTIHVLYRFRKEKAITGDSGAAMLATQRAIGPVIILTSGVLVIGFAVLLLASLKTVFYFGLLSIISVIAALFGDLVILTLILLRLKDE
jgi:predicted RND superfamily exporter protein